MADFFDLSRCEVCPRSCRADRTRARGLCGGSDLPRLARAALHFWEEPPISGTRGSGAVFFSGCALRCVYCQNFEISAKNFGREISISELSEIFRRLEGEGAHNLNLVNPTHFVPQIIAALETAKPKIPVVYNCGGYERLETLRALEGLVDIYLPDLKYYDGAVSLRYSGVSDYFEAASAAVLEMARQVGKPVLDGDGVMRRGLLIRHLILPGLSGQSIKIFNFIRENLPEDTFVSLLRQYVPLGRAGQFPEINRKITRREYERVERHVLSLGFQNGYFQEQSAAGLDFVPAFDLTGVAEP